MRSKKIMLCVICMVILFIAVTVAQADKDYTSKYVGTLKYVPAGSFQLDDNPENISTVSEFRMSETEITRAQFVAVTGLSDPSDTKYSTGQQDPVQRVNLYHALVFCNKLSTLEGLTPVYTINGNTDTARWGSVPLMIEDFNPSNDTALWDAVTADWSVNGYRLPTEMEWMWAAMGADKDNPGHINTKGYAKKFAGSNVNNSIGDSAWYFNNTSHPVGTKQPNELGLYDMSGNVWEWCWDKYDEYPTGKQDNFKGAVSCISHVLRGGSWRDLGSYASVAYRFVINPYIQFNNFGFRVVRR